MYSRRSVFFLVSLMVLAGCVVSPRRGGGYTIGPRGGGSSQGGGASAGGGGMAQAAPPVARATSTEPRALLDEADGHLRARGFQMVGSAVRNPSLSAGQQVAYLLDAQPNACFVAIALGAAGTDLDMVLVDPMGSNIAHHVSPDPTPWVQVCPNQPGRHVIRVQMRRGVGEHYYALYRGPSRADSQLGALLGGGVTQAQTAQLDPGTAARLEALDRSLAADRFGRAQEPMSAVLGEGEERRFPLSLEGGRCYAFATLGGPGARDTDLHILDAGETRLGGDSSVDVDATVRFCAPNSGTYTLQARMYAGQGPLFVAGWAQAAAVGQPTVAAEAVIAAESTGGQSLEEEYRLLDGEMRARGYESFGDSGEGALEAEGSHEFGIDLEGGKCYALLAVGEGRIRDLDIVLTDGSGRELDRDIEQDARPIVRVCAAETGNYRMHVRAASGQGRFVYAAYRWPRGTRGPFGLNGLMYVRLAEVTALLAESGFEPDAEFAPDRGRLRRQGNSGSHRFNLPANQCFAFLVVGGDGVHDLDAALSSGGESLQVDTSRTAFPAVRYCTESAGRYELAVEAAQGSGEYFVQVFRRGS